jgi:hypothetical protein
VLVYLDSFCYGVNATAPQGPPVYSDKHSQRVALRQEPPEHTYQAKRMGNGYQSAPTVRIFISRVLLQTVDPYGVNK